MEENLTRHQAPAHQEGPFPPIAPRGEHGAGVFVPPAPSTGVVLAACQVKVEWLLTDPGQVWVAPVPGFCAPGLEVALATALAALLKAGFLSAHR